MEGRGRKRVDGGRRLRSEPGKKVSLLRSHDEQGREGYSGYKMEN